MSSHECILEVSSRRPFVLLSAKKSSAAVPLSFRIDGSSRLEAFEAETCCCSVAIEYTVADNIVSVRGTGGFV